MNRLQCGIAFGIAGILSGTATGALAERLAAPGAIAQPVAIYAPKGMPGLSKGHAPNGGTATYLYVDAYEYVTAAQASARYTQPAPVLAAGDFHSLAELAAQSADGLQIVEIGWIVFDTDPEPELFVYHWIDGNPTCYNGCGYVQVSSTRIPGMHVEVTDTPQDYGIEYSSDDGNWYVVYQGERIGYFPGSEWNDSFTSIGLVQWFGEIAAATGTPCSQMGNGTFGSQPGSAAISSMAVDGVDAQSLQGTVTLATAYDAGAVTATSYRYGGPGACGSDVIFADGFDGPGGSVTD